MLKVVFVLVGGTEAVELVPAPLEVSVALFGFVEAAGLGRMEWVLPD